MAKSVTYKTPMSGEKPAKIRDKKVGSKTKSFITFGKKTGPKGFRRKAKVVDKKTPAGGRSTVLYGSKKLLKEAGPGVAGKNLRSQVRGVKQDASSVTINGKTYKTKNKTANPNLRKRGKVKAARLKRGGSVKKKMKRGGRAK